MPAAVSNNRLAKVLEAGTQNRQRLLLVGAGLALLTVSVLALERASDELVPAVPVANPPAAITIHTVAAAGGQSWFSSDGTVEAARQAVLAAQSAGRIVERTVEAGDRVHVGQVLVRIDDREASHSEAASRAQVAAATAALNNANQDLERIRALVARQLLAQSALDRAEATQRAALAQVQAQSASAGLSSTQRGFNTVTAPYAGVVAAVQAQVGDMAQAGKPLLTVYDPAQLRVIAHLPLSMLARWPASSKLQLELPSKILSLSDYTVLPTTDANSQVRKIRIPLPAGTGLLPGQYVKVRFAQSGPAGLRIPAAALLVRGEMSAVYVYTETGRWQLRQVRPGQREGAGADEQIEVLAGLSAGERIALEPQRAASLRAGATANKDQP